MGYKVKCTRCSHDYYTMGESHTLLDFGGVFFGMTATEPKKLYPKYGYCASCCGQFSGFGFFGLGSGGKGIGLECAICPNIIGRVSYDEYKNGSGKDMGYCNGCYEWFKAKKEKAEREEQQAKEQEEETKRQEAEAKLTERLQETFKQSWREQAKENEDRRKEQEAATKRQQKRFDAEMERQRREQKKLEAAMERQRKENEYQRRKHEAEMREQREEMRREREEHARRLRDEKRTSLTKLKNEKSSQRQRIIRDELGPVQNEIAKIDQKIQQEEKEMHKFAKERTEDGHKIIVMVGMTGDGKSSFGNRLCGDMSEDAEEGPFKASGDGKSCTKLLKKHIHNGLSVVDCPGWGDTDNKEDVYGNQDVDRAHSNNLCSFLRGCGGVNAFVVVRNGQNCRFDAYFQSQLKYMRELLGDNEFWKHLVVVLTRIDTGLAERQFKKSKKAEQMKANVAKLCNGANKNVAVIPIGLDNYTEALPQFLAAIPSKKFECDSIKSPIDELKQKKAKKVKKKEDIQRRVNSIDREIRDIESQIRRL